MSNNLLEQMKQKLDKEADKLHREAIAELRRDAKTQSYKAFVEGLYEAFGPPGVDPVLQVVKPRSYRDRLTVISKCDRLAMLTVRYMGAPMEQTPLAPLPTLFAFWRYDSFPYVLGGTIVKWREDGAVETKEYGKGHYFKPIKILPVETGKALWQKLESLRAQYREAQKKLHDKMMEEAVTLLPEAKVGG